MKGVYSFRKGCLGILKETTRLFGLDARSGLLSVLASTSVFRVVVPFWCCVGRLERFACMSTGGLQRETGREGCVPPAPRSARVFLTISSNVTPYNAYDSSVPLRISSDKR